MRDIGGGSYGHDEYQNAMLPGTPVGHPGRGSFLLCRFEKPVGGRTLVQGQRNEQAHDTSRGVGDPGRESGGTGRAG